MAAKNITEKNRESHTDVAVDITNPIVFRHLDPNKYWIKEEGPRQVQTEDISFDGTLHSVFRDSTWDYQMLKDGQWVAVLLIRFENASRMEKIYPSLGISYVLWNITGSTHGSSQSGAKSALRSLR